MSLSNNNPLQSTGSRDDWIRFLMEEAVNHTVSNNEDSSYIYGRMVATALTPKFAAILSVIGSATIIYEVVTDHRKNKGQVLTRILVNLSCADLLSSTAWIGSTWMMPSTEDLPYVVFNVGSWATCNLQGFLLQIANAAGPAFNILLSFTYLLVIKYNVREAKLRQWEKVAYIQIWIMALVIAIVPLVFDLYNPGFQICYITPYPLGCSTSIQFFASAGNESAPQCTRGDTADVWAVVSLAFLWLNIAVISILLWMTVHAVAKTERRGTRFSIRKRAMGWGSTQQFISTTAVPIESSTTQQLSSGGGVSSTALTPQPRRTLSRATSSTHRPMWRTRLMKKQARRYVAVFILTYFGATCMILLYYSLGEQKHWFFYLDQFVFFLLPLQGWMNFFVFSRTRKMETRWGKFLQKIIGCDFCCKSCDRNANNHDDASDRKGILAACCCCRSRGDSVSESAESFKRAEESPELQQPTPWSGPPATTDQSAASSESSSQSQTEGMVMVEKPDDSAILEVVNE